MSDIFDKRINRLREILSDREAALITNEKNIGYFCGFFHSEKRLICLLTSAT